MFGLIAGLTMAAATAAKAVTGAVQAGKQKRLAEEQAEELSKNDANYGKYYSQRFQGLQDESMGNQMAMAQSGGSAGAQGSNMRNAMSQSPLLAAAASRAADAYALGRTNDEGQTLARQHQLQRNGQQAQQAAVMNIVDLVGTGATGAMNAGAAHEQQVTGKQRFDEWSKKQSGLNQQASARQDLMGNAYAQRGANALTEAQDSGYVQDWTEQRTQGNQYQDLVTQVGNNNPASNMASNFGDPLGVNKTNRIRR